MFSGEILDKRKRGFAYDEIGDRAFVFILGLYVVLGALASAVVAAMTYTWQITNVWVILAIGLGLPILGIIISFTSDNWLLSTGGYALVVVPFGALVGPVVALYELPSVFQVLITTMVVATSLWIVGLVIPPIVQNWSGYIVGALLVIIAGDVARIIMPSFGVQPIALGIWDWVAVFLFSGLIVYDVNKAMQRPHTLDNAVDAAVGIYLDILNLFLRLLRIMGTKKAR